jgi:hypothetical protein
LDLTREDRSRFGTSDLLTGKPVLIVANVGDEGPGRPAPALLALREAVAAAGGRESLVAVSSRMEVELAALEPGDREEFMAELAWEGTGLERVVQAAFRLLDLVTFFTANEKEAHAWAIRRGTRAPEAAGVIHTDFQRGFIRAETVAVPQLEKAGSLKAARELGLVRSEGREYVVQDGDLILFRFNI